MPREYDYHCTKCGKETKRELLTPKKVIFTEMGAGGKTIRARVIDWLCPPCVKSDPHWNLPPNQSPSDRETTSEVLGQ